MKFGKKLRTLRKAKKLSQQEVADKIGVSLRAYAAYETQNVRPRTVDKYEKLASVLGCSVNDLLSDAYDINTYDLGTKEDPSGSVTTAVEVGVNFLSSAVIKLIKPIWGGMSYDEWAKKQNQMALMQERKMKQFEATATGIILTALGEKGITCRVGDLKDLAPNEVPDKYINLDGQIINEWWFVFWSTECREYDQFVYSQRDRAYLLFNRFGLAIPDPNKKVSIVINDKDLYDELCSVKGNNSYRGNMTCILIDTEESKILDEELISSYDLEDPEDKLPIL